MSASWESALPPALGARLRALLDDPHLPGGAAAFDADGTLWAGDLGELVLKAMIGLGRAPGDAWRCYESLLASDAPAACAYCVELLRGSSVDELERWGRELVRAGQHGPVREAVVGLALALAERGCEVWVVSGTNQWTVRQGVDAIGLDPARVLALSGPAPGGMLSGEVSRPLTCAAGKVAALHQATARPLRLAVGNALYDVELLEAAELPLAVAPRAERTPLRALARARGWPVWDV